MSDELQLDWAEIARRLQEPFPPELVDFRPQGRLTPKNRGRALAYVDARAVAERLDTVIGPQHWTFRPEVVSVGQNGVQAALGTLTIHGVAKTDIGDSERFEANKAAVSDALKRAAVLWGVGRYLYKLEAEWVDGEPGHKEGEWFIPEAEVARLRQRLPRPAGSPPIPSNRTTQAQPAPPAPVPAAPAESAELPDPAAIRDLQLKQIRALLPQAGLAEAEVCAGAGVARLEDLSAVRADAGIKKLQAAARRKGQASA